MSEKFSCEVIRDLIPSYVDDICSKESRELVEKHIKECKECREILESMKEDIKFENVNNRNSSQDNIDEQKVMQAVNQKIKNDIKKKTMVYKIVCLIIVLILIILMLPVKTIPSSSVKFDYYTFKVDDHFTDEVGEYEKPYYAIEGAVLLYSDGADTENAQMLKFVGDDGFQLAYPLYVDTKWAKEHEYITIARIRSEYPVEKYTYDVYEENGQNVLTLNSVKTKIMSGKGEGNHELEFIVSCAINDSRINY